MVLNTLDYSLFNIRLTILFLLFYRCGLTIQAFNMLPVGCLDGGRSVQVNTSLTVDLIFTCHTEGLM